jgi:hypothetical protein
MGSIHMIFQVVYSSSCTTALGSKQPLTEVSDVKGRQNARLAIFITMYEPILEIVGTSLTVSQPFGPTWPVTGIALPRLSLILHYPLLNLLMQYEYTSIFHVWQDNTTINQYNHTFLLISRISSLLWVCYMHTYYNII